MITNIPMCTFAVTVDFKYNIILIDVFVLPGHLVSKLLIIKEQSGDQRL